MSGASNTSRIAPALWFAAAFALVVVYVNVFDLWRALAAALGGKAMLLPFGLTGAAALAVALFGRRTGRPDMAALALAALFAAAGLAIADPLFPAKRVHVPEYMLLALVVRAGLRSWLQGRWLLGMGALMTALYGCHDELIQGLHPDRTYGLADMTVNALGGLAGSFLAHGLGVLPGRGVPARLAPSLVQGALAAIAGTLLMVVALPAFRGLAAPVWTILPALAGALVFALADAGQAERSGPAKAAAAAVLLAVSAVVYPLLPHVAPLVFE